MKYRNKILVLKRSYTFLNGRNTIKLVVSGFNRPSKLMSVSFPKNIHIRVPCIGTDL